MPTLACIIPVTGTTVGLETTLLSVLERRPDDCEVLVVLGTPYEDPYNLQGEVQFLDANRQAGLVECINVGIAATSAPIVHVLANGFEATDGWTAQALAHFSNPRVASVTPAIHDVQNRAELLAAGVGYKAGGRRTVCGSLPTGDAGNKSVGPTIHAAFFRKSAIEAVGKVLPEELGDELADLDFALSLRRCGWQNVIEPSCRVLGPSAEVPKSLGLAGGLQSERFFWRHATEMGRNAEIVAHLPAVLGSLARATWRAPAQLLGRFAAMCQFGNYRLYQQQLANAALASGAVQACLVAHAERLAERKAQVPARHTRIDEPHTLQPTQTNTRESSRRR